MLRNEATTAALGAAAAGAMVVATIAMTSNRTDPHAIISP